MEPLTPGRVTSRAGSPSLSHRAFPPFCPQPPHGAPSSLLCSPQLCQRDGLPVPFQIPAFLMPLGVRQVWASHTPSRLAAPCSRNGFVILRTGGSPSVALHPALRQRSYFRFRVGGAYPEGTCTPLTLRLGGALGAGRARDGGPAWSLGLFVVSSGFQKMLYGRCQQVDDADERVIVAVSPGPAFGGLEDAVERLDARVAVA